MRVRGNPKNGETAMFPRAVWTRGRCPVASGVSGVSKSGNRAFQGYSTCIPYNIGVRHQFHVAAFRRRTIINLHTEVTLFAISALSPHTDLGLFPRWHRRVTAALPYRRRVEYCTPWPIVGVLKHVWYQMVRKRSSAKLIPQILRTSYPPIVLPATASVAWSTFATPL